MPRRPPPPGPVTRGVESGPDHAHLMQLENCVFGGAVQLPSGAVVPPVDGMQWRVKLVPNPAPLPGRYPILVQEPKP